MPSFIAAALCALGAAYTAHAGLAGDMPIMKGACEDGECAPTWARCSQGGKHKSCCFPGDTCLIKDSRFGRCQPMDSDEPARWPSCHQLQCTNKPSLGGGSTGKKMMKKSSDVKGFTDRNDDGEDDNSAFDIGMDPNDGRVCQASGRDHCSRVTKCCASSRMRSTNCCQAGSSCVRKNSFYAACLTEERRKINTGRGWEGTVLTCGQDVGIGM